MISKEKNFSILKEDIENVWDPKRFGIVRYPLEVCELENKKDFSEEVDSVLDMPIKLPNTDIKVPHNLRKKSIMEIIEKCVEFEKNINPNWEDYYIYLTVHHSFVKKEESQRRTGAHIDGMQGEKYKKKMKVCHSYIVSDAVPTRFFNQNLPTNLCEKTQNWFYEFDKVKDYSKSNLSKPFIINLMTAYSLHQSELSKEDTTRTFVRLEFSLKQFNRIGNTKNELFDLDWEFVERDIPDHLKKDIFN